MKRILALLLVLAGCGAGAKTVTTTTAPTRAQICTQSIMGYADQVITAFASNNMPAEGQAQMELIAQYGSQSKEWNIYLNYVLLNLDKIFPYGVASARATILHAVEQGCQNAYP